MVRITEELLENGLVNLIHPRFACLLKLLARYRDEMHSQQEDRLKMWC